MDANIGDLVVDELFVGFYQTWRKARGDSRVPSRQDIRLRDFAQYAGNMIIFERRQRRDFRARLVGGLIAERIIKYGREANLFKVFAGDILHGAEIWFNSLIDVPCAGFTEYSMTYLNGRCKACELLMLPVRNKRGDPHLLCLGRVLGLARTEKPRSTICLGDMYFQGQFIDIGYGLPDGGAEGVLPKPKPANLTLWGKPSDDDPGGPLLNPHLNR